MNRAGSPFSWVRIRQKRKLAVSLGILLTTWCAWMTCRGDDLATLRARANQVFGPLPAQMPGAGQDNPAMVRLGRRLFFDKRLSANQTVSCNTCHPLANGGAYPGVAARVRSANPVSATRPRC